MMYRGVTKLACAWGVAAASAACSMLFDPGKFMGDSASSCGDDCDGDSSDIAVVPIGKDADDGSLDAGNDAFVGPPRDSGPDGTALPNTFCSTVSPKPDFCRDFDDGQAYSDGFTVTTQGTCELGANGAAAKSLPNSLFANITTNVQQCFMKRTFGVANSKIHVAFDLRMDDFQNSGNGAMVTEIALNVGTSSEHYLRLMEASDHATMEEWHGATFGQYTVSPAIKGVWSTVDITLAIAPTPHLTIKVNGTTVTNSNLPGTWSSGAPQISFGLPYVPNSGPWRVREDNIIVETE